MYDFDLEDWTPADDEAAEAIEELCLHAPDLLPVSAQIDGSEHLLALGGLAAPRAPGGYPWLRVVPIARDPLTATARVEHAQAATLALAKGWLLERGADPDRQVRDPEQLAPVDPQTHEIESRTREAGNRLRVLEHSCDYDTDQSAETRVVMHDDKPVDAELPFVVQIEQVLRDPWRYSVREGRFPDRDTAVRWLTTREDPLSQATGADPVGRSQTAAARSRTAAAGPGPTGPTLAHPAQSSGTAPTTGPGR
ncbi:hypothetical protein [Embleya sp. NPDC059259]|uniref:hypothetical protein n=1 Tax=unclassified Embleya TaxID=2699296 RepID=UPI003685C3EA